MAIERRRRILRFFGPRGDLLAAEAPGIVVYDATGHVRVRVEVDDFIDIAPVGDELWVVGPGRLTRLSARDGRLLGSEPIDYLDPGGRFLQSSTAPHLPVWHAARPVVVRSSPARTETPGPGGELILPIADGRWLLWQGGQLRLWRSIGEAWRKPLGEPGSRAIDAQLVLDGRLFVLAQQRVGTKAGDEGELRLLIAGVSDGVQTTQLRVPAASQLVIAARRGLALVRSGDRLSVMDLRFGRWIRDLVLPPGITDVAVDEGLQWIALANPDGLELVRPDSLAAPAPSDADAPPVAAVEPEASTSTDVIELDREAMGEPSDEAPATPTGDDREHQAPLADAPLVRLDPVSVTPTATGAEMRDPSLRRALCFRPYEATAPRTADQRRIYRPPRYSSIA